jgi:hypothetical protein
MSARADGLLTPVLTQDVLESKELMNIYSRLSACQHKDTTLYRPDSLALQIMRARQFSIVGSPIFGADIADIADNSRLFVS